MLTLVFEFIKTIIPMSIGSIQEENSSRLCICEETTNNLRESLHNMCLSGIYYYVHFFYKMQSNIRTAIITDNTRIHQR